MRSLTPIQSPELSPVPVPIGPPNGDLNASLRLPAYPLQTSIHWFPFLSPSHSSPKPIRPFDSCCGWWLLPAAVPQLPAPFVSHYRASLPPPDDAAAACPLHVSRSFHTLCSLATVTAPLPPHLGCCGSRVRAWRQQPSPTATAQVPSQAGGVVLPRLASMVAPAMLAGGRHDRGRAHQGTQGHQRRFSCSSWGAGMTAGGAPLSAAGAAAEPGAVRLVAGSQGATPAPASSREGRA